MEENTENFSQDEEIFEENITETPLLTLNYGITEEEYKTAYKAYQKKYVFQKSIIYSAIFLVIILLFLQQVLVKPDYTVAWFCIAVCVIIAGYGWFEPFSIRKHVFKSLENIRDDQYTTDFFDGRIRISTKIADQDQSETSEEKEEIRPTILAISPASMQVLELSDMYLLVIRKKLFYLVPKKSCSEKDTEKINEIFEKNLEKKFFKLVKSDSEKEN
ncbi:MAG: hypothetical protein RR540_02490 [Oscillospiraceae bacterium]